MDYRCERMKFERWQRLHRLHRYVHGRNLQSQLHHRQSVERLQQIDFLLRGPVGERA